MREARVRIKPDKAEIRAIGSAAPICPVCGGAEWVNYMTEPHTLQIIQIKCWLCQPAR